MTGNGPTADLDILDQIDMSRVRLWEPGQCTHVWTAGCFRTNDKARCRLPEDHDGQHKPMMPATAELLGT